MKVLYIATAYPRGPDDVITPWLGETLRRLGQAGVQAEVLAPSYRGLGDQRLDGVRVHRFRYAPARWEDLTHDQTAPDRLRQKPAYAALLPGYLAAGAAAAARIARRDGFDIVHVHWPVPHAAFGMAARAAAGIPLVLTFHGVELTWTGGQLRALKPFLRRAIRSADAITANSSYTEGLIRAVYDRPVVRVPFGATIAPPTEPAPATAPTGRMRLLFVGRLVERKGVTVLLQALADLPAGRRPELHIVGDGPLRAALATRAERLGLAGDVVFHGFVAEAELARLYGDCEAFVLPAIVDEKGDTEGLGVVLIEALAHGKPAIASAAGGIVDIVRDGETGLLVPPGDPEALRTAITRLEADPALRERLGRGGRDLVAREFSWPVIIDRLRALYERLARASKSPEVG